MNDIVQCSNRLQLYLITLFIIYKKFELGLMMTRYDLLEARSIPWLTSKYLSNNTLGIRVHSYTENVLVVFFVKFTFAWQQIPSVSFTMSFPFIYSFIHIKTIWWSIWWTNCKIGVNNMKIHVYKINNNRKQTAICCFISNLVLLVVISNRVLLTVFF